MLKRTLAECREFVAGDHTVLWEFLHPTKQVVNLGYSFAHGKLAPGRRSKWHVLTSSEVSYFIEGKGRFTIDTETCLVESGSRIYVPPGASGRQTVLGEYRDDRRKVSLSGRSAWRIEDEALLE